MRGVVLEDTRLMTNSDLIDFCVCKKMMEEVWFNLKCHVYSILYNWIFANMLYEKNQNNMDFFPHEKTSVNLLIYLLKPMFTWYLFLQITQCPISNVCVQNNKNIQTQLPQWLNH